MANLIVKYQTRPQNTNQGIFCDIFEALQAHACEPMRLTPATESDTVSLISSRDLALLTYPPLSVSSAPRLGCLKRMRLQDEAGQASSCSCTNAPGDPPARHDTTSPASRTTDHSEGPSSTTGNASDASKNKAWLKPQNPS